MVMVEWLSSWTRVSDGKQFAGGSVPLAGIGGLVATELYGGLRQRLRGRTSETDKRPPF
jgi:hypothetical protein